ncbi:MAG: hypothetical protein COT85_05665 [Chlamydiae bacterium CG10_big_fil_rev_8_21_14_0_10_42_34]|nr:MAG: hypothetical protein COT85_05665 [Chlamydiae bacterium CG10_big_fil_rev_8_21_14_0_10_42_34]
MPFQPITSHWKKALFVLRSLVYLVFITDILIWFHLVPLPSISASKWTYLPWFLYRLANYLFFEFLWHHYAKWRDKFIHIFTIILALLLCSISLDLAGNTFALFTKYWWYDRMIHLTTLSWALSSLFWLFSTIFVEKHKLTHLFWFVPYGIISGVALGSVMHELSEYMIDLITHSQVGTMSMNDTYDTARDLFLNMIGSFVFVTVYIIHHKFLIKKS